MTPEEMQKRSNEKVAQINSLMNMLHIEVKAKDRIMPDGYIERVVVFIDHENYPPKEEKKNEEPEKTTEQAAV